MRSTQLRRAAVLLLATALSVAGLSVPASADQINVIPLRGTGELVADVAHGHLFVSEYGDVSTAAPGDAVVVADLTGRTLQVLNGLPGADGMALSADGSYLDVSLTRARSVARISTTTLQVERIYPMPADAPCPGTLGESGGRMWVTLPCSPGPPSYAGLVSLDIATGAATLYQGFGSTVTALPGGDSQTVFTTPQRPELLVISAATGGETYVYDTSTTAPPTRYDGKVAALSVDGSTVFSIDRDGINRAPVSDPTQRTRVASTQNVDNVAVSPDGQYLFASYAGGDYCSIEAATGAVHRCSSDLGDSGVGRVIRDVAPLGGSSAAFLWDNRFPSFDHVLRSSIRVLDDGSPPATRISFYLVDPATDEPREATGVQVGGWTALSGRFMAPDPEGKVISVHRTGPGGTVPLPSITTDAGGSFTFRDRSMATGLYHYVFDYAGSPAQSPTQAQYDWEVWLPPLLRTDLTAGQGFDEMIADPVHRRVFVAEPGQGQVQVLDDSGVLLKTIGNLGDVRALTLSKDSQQVFAVVPSQDKVIGISTTALIVSSTWLTGTSHNPVALGVVGNRVLVGYTYSPTFQTFSNIGAFNPAASGFVTTLTPTNFPTVWGDTMTILEDASSPTSAYIASDRDPAALYDLGSSSITRRATTPWCGFPRGYSKDRSWIYCPARVSLSQDHHPTMVTGLNVPVESPSGTQLAGFPPFQSVPLVITPVGSREATSFHYPAGGNRGYTWSSDEARVLVLGRADPDKNYVTVLDALTPILTRTTTQVLGTAQVDTPLSLSGTLRKTDGTPIVGSLRLLRNDNGVLTSVTSGASASDGTFTFTDIPHRLGGASYVVLFDGDGHRTQSFATVDTTVVQRQGAITLTASPSSITSGQTATLTAHVDTVHSGGTVALSAQDGAGTTTTVGTQPISAPGDVAFAVTPQSTITYTATWSGDAEDTAASSSPVTVTVTQSGGTTGGGTSGGSTSGGSTSGGTTGGSTTTGGTTGGGSTTSGGSTGGTSGGGSTGGTSGGSTTSGGTTGGGAAPPTTTFTSLPPQATSSRTATVAFRVSDSSATTTCSLDGAAPQTCASPHTVTGLSDGPHSMTVRASSGVLQEQSPPTARWIVDTVRPSARAQLLLTSPVSAGRVTARWAGVDPAPSSGVARYAVRLTRANGSIAFSSASTTATTVTIAATQGEVFQLTVIASDVAVNASSAVTTRLAVPYDDTRFTFSGAWARQSASDDYGTSDATASFTTKSARFTATGSIYALLVTTCSSCGRVDVFVGGTRVRTLDLYASTVHRRVVVVVHTGSRATRTLTFRPTGTHRAGAKGSAVHLDGLRVS